MPYKYRLRTLFIVISFFCFLVVPIRLFEIQILRGKEYQKMVEERRIRHDQTDAPRGRILSRDGVVLAAEQPAFDIQIRFREVEDELDLGERLSNALGRPMPEIHDTLKALKKDVVANALKSARKQARRNRRTKGFKYLLADHVPIEAGANENELPKGSSRHSSMNSNSGSTSVVLPISGRSSSTKLQSGSASTGAT